MQTIENNCRLLSERRAKLRVAFEKKKKAISAVDQAFDEELRELQAGCESVRTAILADLEQNRTAFLKPKTRKFHGIKVGFEKQRDSVEMPDEAILVDRIERMLPARQAETVLDRTVTIIKTAFKKLPRELLQKLGCTIKNGGDGAVVHPDDDDIETLVKKSLGGEAEEAK